MSEIEYTLSDELDVTVKLTTTRIMIEDRRKKIKEATKPDKNNWLIKVFGEEFNKKAKEIYESICPWRKDQDPKPFNFKCCFCGITFGLDDNLFYVTISTGEWNEPTITFCPGCKALKELR